MSDSQKAIIDQLQSGDMDSRKIPSTTLQSLVKKGIIETYDTEKTDVGVSPEVLESRAYALAVGDATHKAILEPHLFDSETWNQHWQLSPTKTITSKQAREAQANDPRALITPEIVDTARRCRDAVYRHKLANELLTQPRKNECSAVAWSSMAEVWQKARFDSLPDNPSYGILDIKTTHSGLGLNQLRGTVYKMGYHLQAALYLDVLAAIEGQRRGQFHVIFVTKNNPFICRCVELCSAPEDENFINKGRELYQERRAMWAVSWFEQMWEAYENDNLTTLKA